MEKWFSLVLGFLCLDGSFAQTVFWSDTFEDVGAPSSGVRTPELEMGAGGPPYTDYFLRANNADLNLHALVGAYTGFEGLRFWAGEDHDNIDGADGVPPDPEVHIDWTGINISGRTNLQFIGRFAANPGNFWDHSNPTTDYLTVEASIDGGPWATVIAFYGAPMTPGPLREDTDANTVGDGISLSGVFQEFTRSIAGTGTTLSLRFRAFSDNGSSEEWAIDHFRLTETSVLPVEFAWFEVRLQGDSQIAVLEWKTWSERNNHGFKVERAGADRLWTEIGFVPGKGDASGSQTYRFMDQELRSVGVYYYRLRQIDFDGTQTLSDVRLIHIPPQQQAPVIYPNPVKENLYFTAPQHGRYRVVDRMGRLHLQGQFRGAEHLQLTGLVPGDYLLQLEPFTEQRTVKFIIY